MKLEGLDHVALVVRDVDASVRWYVEVLGLEQRYAAEWGGVPAFVGRGTSGVALFPLEEEASSLTEEAASRTQYFAWRVDLENFAVAQRELKKRSIDSNSQTTESRTRSTSATLMGTGSKLRLTSWDRREA
ncbi:MAG: VOC family protein [Chthoniobacterales bacterium]|nr:VOC family protein [Chthoniobacterales bacterium]